MRSHHLKYALAIMAALTLGLGISFWRSASENARLVRASHISEMALEAAQDEVKSLREKFYREVKGREFAENAQEIAENARQAAQKKLIIETNLHKAADLARIKVEAELGKVLANLALETKLRQAEETAHMNAEANLQDAKNALAQTAKARQTAEVALVSAETELQSVKDQLARETKVRQSAELGQQQVGDVTKTVKGELTEEISRTQLVGSETNKEGAVLDSKNEGANTLASDTSNLQASQATPLDRRDRTEIPAASAQSVANEQSPESKAPLSWTPSSTVQYPTFGPAQNSSESQPWQFVAREELPGR